MKNYWIFFFHIHGKKLVNVNLVWFILYLNFLLKIFNGIKFKLGRDHWKFLSGLSLEKFVKSLKNSLWIFLLFIYWYFKNPEFLNRKIFKVTGK